MRILIHGLNYAPELTGIGKYSGEMAEWLAERGHEVRAVVAPPYYPEWRIGPHYRGSRYAREVRSGVTVYRCPIWVPSRPSTLKRLVHLASFALSSLPVMLRHLAWRPDVVMVIEPPLFCAPQAWLVAKLSGARSCLHIQDFEIDAALGLGMLSAGPLQGLVARLEAWLMRRFDLVSTISHAMLRRLKSKGVRPEQARLLPNWVDTGLIFPDPDAGAALRMELGIPKDAVLALYSGNLGEKQGLDILIDAAKMLSDRPGIQFLICGEGAAKQRLCMRAEGLTNVRFIPLQPLDRLNALLNAADLHLLPQRADAADLVMPSKLTGILSVGGALIATAHPGTEVGQVTEAAGGRVCSPEDVEAMVQEIAFLGENAVARMAMGRKARDYALHHLERHAVLQMFEEALAGNTTKSQDREVETTAIGSKS